MPQIPTVVSPEQVASPRMSPQIAGEPGQSLTRTGEALTRTADYGLQVEEHVRDAQEHLALLTAGNQITAAHNTYLETLAQSGDPDNLPDPVAWKEDLKAQLGENPKYADPRVARALSTHIDAIGEDARHVTTMRQLTLQREQETAQLGDLKQTVAFEMAEAPDLDMRGLARGRFETAIAGAVNHGWVTPQEAAAELRTLDSTAEDVEIRNALATYEPARLQAMIDKTNQHPEAFKEMDPRHFAELRKQLEHELPIAKKMKGEADDQVQAGTLVTQYTNDPRFRDPETGKTDFDKAAATASTDDNLSLALQDRVSKELKYRAGLVMKEERDWNADALAKYYTQASELKLSNQQIDGLQQQWAASGRKPGVGISSAVATQLKEISARTLSQQRGERREEKAEQHAQRQERIEDERRQSDLVAGQLMKKIQNFEYVSKPEIYSHVPQLHWKAAQEIVTMSEAFAVLPTDTKQALTSANKIIDSSIAPPKGMGIPGTAEQIKRADEAKMELSGWITAQDKEVKAKKRPPLTTKEIHDKAQEIIPQHAMSLNDQVESMRKSMDPGQTGTPPKSEGLWDRMKSAVGAGGAPKSKGDDPDYDMEAAKAAGVKPDPKTGHMTDDYKRPHHITFSDQSKYSKPGQEGGHWKYVDKGGGEMEDTKPGGTWQFFASPFNLTQHTPDELREYFRSKEAGSKLFLPIGTKNGLPVYDLGNGKWQTGTK